MLESVASAYEGLKAAFGIVQGLNAANTQVQINEAKLPLLQHILDAQRALSDANEAQTAAAERIKQLEQQIVRLEDWSADKQRYELKRYHPGSVAYALKEGMENGEVPHKLCPNCYSRGEKSFLQPTGDSIRRYRVHRCFSCRAEVPLGPEIIEGVPPPDDGPVLA